MKTRMIAIASLTALALTPTALASDKFEFDFHFSPVEISSEIGAKEVYEELKATIEKECEPSNHRERVFQRAEAEECMNDTLEQAIAAIDDPTLTATHKAANS